MAKCKSCGADFIWIKMQSGKSMPCDADQITYWEKKNGTKVIVTPNGEVIHAETEGDLNTATGVGYISHFATCPNANQHRRRTDG